MKIIQNVLQNTKAAKLWFSMAVVFMVILNASSVEAKSLRTGEEFKEKDGKVIKVVSSDEVELDGGNGIALGKYTVDGDRVRIVISGLGTSVEYYKITPEGLVEEKGGRVFYSKTGLTASKFTFIGDEVTDKKTGLIWRRCAEGMVYRGGICAGKASRFNYEAALQHAKSEASHTGKAWRVPEKIELVSIVDKSHGNPTIDPSVFPATPADGFWSASLYVGDSAYAWVLGLGGGITSDYSDRNGSYCVRLVRGDRILPISTEEEKDAALAKMKRRFKDNGNRTVADRTGFVWVKADKTTPQEFSLRVADMQAHYTVRKDAATREDVVAPPPGSNVYLAGMQWQWRPILELQKGKSYLLHITSLDVEHGFSLQSEDINFQVYPGIEMVFKMTPNKSGQFSITCMVYCGGVTEMGHHTMLGKIYVKP